MKKPVVLGLIFVAIVLGVIIYSSMNLSSYKVEVCMDFQGKESCRTASGTSEEFALRSAIGNACAMIASGVTETISCQGSTPKSIKWLSRGN